jgi:hypothetical protein
MFHFSMGLVIWVYIYTRDPFAQFVVEVTNVVNFCLHILHLKSVTFYFILLYANNNNIMRTHTYSLK